MDKSIENCFHYVFRDLSSENAKKTIFDYAAACISGNKVHAFPYNVLLKISSQCNLRCEHCFYHSNEQNYTSDNDFSTEEFLRLIDFLTDEINIINCAISGGEPFLNKDILVLLEALKQKNIYIGIQTNGTLITEKMAQGLGKLLNPKTDHIQVSLDGATKETHDKIRGEGNFDKSINAIKFLRKNNINVNISYTMMSENIKEVPKAYELCKELLCRKIMLNNIKVCDETQEHLKPDLGQVFTHVSELINKIKKDNSVVLELNLKVCHFLQTDTGKQLLDDYLQKTDIPVAANLMCHKHNSVSVCANGNVCLCTNAEEDNFCLGNLREKSFYEIWGNRYSSPLFQQRIAEKSVCRKCAYINLCNAGCPVEALRAYGDINYPDPDCFYGKLLVDEYNANGANYVK